MAELKALSKLKMAGKLHYWRGTIEIDEYELHTICDEIQAEHDKAVAAIWDIELTEEVLRCLENDWNISASWDGLRKLWNIELTEEGVRLRDAAHGTLTAEQVRGVLLLNLPHREYYSIEQTDAWQAIADELNAMLGRIDEPDGGLIANVLAPVCVDEKERRVFERGRIRERFAQQIFKEATS